jgi:hypothetical protein
MANSCNHRDHGQRQESHHCRPQNPFGSLMLANVLTGYFILGSPMEGGRHFGHGIIESRMV